MMRIFRLVASISLIATFALLIGCGLALADQEPNDDSGSAEVITAGEHSGDLTYDTDETDYYKFMVKGGQSVKVAFTSGTGQDFLSAHLEDWELYTYYSLSSKGNQKTSGIWFTANETEDDYWFLRVVMDTEGGGYDFTLTIEDQDDGGIGRDAGGTTAGAEAIKAGDTVNGYLADDDEEDVYKFLAGEGDIISIELTADPGSDFIYLDVWDWEEWTIFDLKSKEDVSEQDKWHTANETSWNWWFIVVSLDTANGNYTFDLTVVRQDDAGLGVDAPDPLGEAIELAPGTYSGHLEDADEKDSFRFQMGKGDCVRINFSSQAADDFQYLTLHDWEEWMLFDLNSKQGSHEKGHYYTANETEVKWYYVQVSMDTGPGEYQFVMEIGHQDDAASAEDVPSAFATAVPLEKDKNLMGYLGDLDVMDAYYLEVVPGDIVIVTLTSDSVGDQWVNVYDEAEIVVAGVKASQGTTSTWEVWTANESEAERWFLVVDITDDPDGAWGSYTLNVVVGHQDDAGSGEDVAATCARGFELQEGEYTGHLGGSDRADVYKVPAQTGWNVTVTLTNQESTGLKVHIIGDCGSGTSLALVTSQGGTPGEKTVTVPDGFTAGSFIYLKAEPEVGWTQGSYVMEVEVVQTPADDEGPVITFADPPTKAKQGKDTTLSLTVTDNEALEGVTLFFKIDDEVVWNELAMTSVGDTYSATIAKDEIKGAKRVHYYIVAEDAAGNTERFGTETTPKSLTVTKPDDKDDGPGFGALLAAAALIAALAAASGRRR